MNTHNSRDQPEGVEVESNETGDEVPVSVFFFPNGMAAVCNSGGEQIGKFQGRHNYTIKTLREAGYDWITLPDVNGSPR